MEESFIRVFVAYFILNSKLLYTKIIRLRAAGIRGKKYVIL